MSAAWASIIVCFALFLLPGASYAEKRPLTVGFIETVIPNVDPKDARAALEMWTGDLVLQAKREKAVAQVIEGVQVTAMTSLSDARTRIKAHQFDLITLPATYYLKLGKPADLEPVAVTARGETPGERYGLVVRRESDARQIKDLKGKRLLVQSGLSDESPSFLWVESLLTQAKLPGVLSSFPTAQAEIKPSRLILPVFFRQADACVVTMQAFETMAELNPQVREQLKIIVESPPLPETIICIGAHLGPEFKRILTTYIHGLQALPRGQQIMTLFQINTILPYKDEYLLPVERLMK